MQPKLNFIRSLFVWENFDYAHCKNKKVQRTSYKNIWFSVIIDNKQYSNFYHDYMSKIQQPNFTVYNITSHLYYRNLTKKIDTNSYKLKHKHSQTLKGVDNPQKRNWNNIKLFQMHNLTSNYIMLSQSNHPQMPLQLKT